MSTGAKRIARSGHRTSIRLRSRTAIAIVALVLACAAAVTWLGNGSDGAPTRSSELLRLMEHDTIERVAAIREANERRRESQARAAEATSKTEHQKALVRIALLTALARK